ncbi:MAG TPA: class I SAM-dependent methyltransferase, partial [Candidatus Eisenbacteria bacterium]
GLDVSSAMLDLCRAKLAGAGRKADLAVGDMRDFTRPRRYALVMIPFNAFLHNATTRDQLATLRCSREHLEPGGRLMFHVFHPDLAKLLENDGTPRHLKTLALPGGESMRVTDTGRLDPVEQRVWIGRRVERLDPSGTVTATHDLTFDLRYLWKPETELLLTAAGFSRFEARGGFEEPQPPKAGSSLVWTAWRD